MSRSHSAHQSSKPHNVAAATGRQLQLLHILATAAVETEAPGAMAEGPEAEGAAWANCAACKEASQHVHQSSNPHNPVEAAIGWQWQLLHIGCRASEAEGAAMVELAVSPSASSSLNNATMRWQPHQHIDIARTASSSCNHQRKDNAGHTARCCDTAGPQQCAPPHCFCAATSESRKKPLPPRSRLATLRPR